MPEPDNNPTEQNQQVSSQQSNGPVDWEARYKGLSRKFDEQHGLMDQKDQTIASLTSQLEQLKAQAVSKDAEHNAAITQRDKTIQDTVQAKAANDQELKDLRAFKMKVDVAKELGKPGLLKIIEKIPNMENRDALKSLLSDFASFADEAALEREKQLTSGLTSPNALNAETKSTVPQTEKDWEAHINSLPLGSPERAKAFDDYYAFLETKNAKK